MPITQSLARGWIARSMLGIGLAAGLLGAAAAPALAQAELPADVVAAAKAEGKVTIYTSAVDAEMQDIAAVFEKSYPGIKIEWLRFPSTTLFARFVGEFDSKVYTADVLFSGSTQLYQQRPELFQPLTPELVPNAKSLLIAAAKPVYAIGEIVPHAVTFNNAVVTKAEIEAHLKTWEGLADPYWKGKIALVDPKISTNVVSWLLLMRQTYGEAWVRGFLANQFKVVGTGTSGAQQVAAGAFQLVVPTVQNHSSDVRAQGAPLTVYVPEGPSHALEQGTAIPVRVTHPNAARVYMNWKLGQDAAKLICKNLGVPNVPAPAGANCPALSPKHVGSNDLLTAEQQREIMEQLGLKP
ncbi:MAG: extracellular solute-binding protein [Burkholderiales bacterium]|nr:extracellular solute-binding protein [Burkholderiales bacterium]